MIIRDFKQTDFHAVLAMVTTFYTSPGVLHEIPTENFANAYNEMCNGGSGRLRGLLIEQDGIAAGYCQLSFSYSTEANGLVVLIEELFILPEFRGYGLGTAMFAYIKNEYKGKAARLRLEVAPENKRAQKLYESLGFEAFPYMQMIQENF